MKSKLFISGIVFFFLIVLNTFVFWVKAQDEATVTPNTSPKPTITCTQPPACLCRTTGLKCFLPWRNSYCACPAPTAKVTPSITPTKAIETPTVTPTSLPVPTQPATCVCKADDSCDSSCLSFSTPSAALKCTRESVIGPTPDQAAKNLYCKRYYRTSGDVDGNNKIDSLDYFYYVRVVNGGQVPADINADVNGDGVVSPSDRAIIVQNINNPPNPTPTSGDTPTPTSVVPTNVTLTPTPASTNTPIPTATKVPTPTSKPSPTPLFGVRYGCDNGCTTPISSGWFTSQTYCQTVCKSLNLFKTPIPTSGN